MRINREALKAEAAEFFAGYGLYLDTLTLMENVPKRETTMTIRAKGSADENDEPLRPWTAAADAQEETEDGD